MGSVVGLVCWTRVVWWVNVGGLGMIWCIDLCLVLVLIWCGVMWLDCMFVVEVVCVGLLVMSVNLWCGCLVLGVVRVCITWIC